MGEHIEHKIEQWIEHKKVDGWHCARTLVALKCSKESTGDNNRESFAGEALMDRAEREALRASVAIKARRVQQLRSGDLEWQLRS